MRVSIRDEILNVAGALFYREGIRAVGVERIIEKAGVAKATLYRHFPSKEHLVAAYLSERHERVTERARHVRVDLRDHQLGGLEGCSHDIDRDTEANEPKLIGRADLKQCDVDLHSARADELRNLGQENRHEVRASGLNCGAHIGTDEESRVPETALHLARHVGRWSERQDVHHVVVGEAGALERKRTHKPIGLGGAGADEDPSTGHDAGDRLRRGAELARVLSLPAAAHGCPRSSAARVAVAIAVAIAECATATPCFSSSAILCSTALDALSPARR